MKKKKLQLFIIILVLMLLVNVSYAFYIYNNSDQSFTKFITGSIYLKFTDESKSINLMNAFPESLTSARSRNDNVLNFKIAGKNTTTNNNIYYEIKLLYGEDMPGMTRLNDKDIRFDLIETINGVSNTVLSNINYDDFNNKVVYINTIDSNTIEDIEVLYQLRMWISEDVTISDTDPDADYTTKEYFNRFANVKISVYGDLIYKELEYDIEYFLNGGTQENNAVLTYKTTDETFDLPLPTKLGYNFLGWYDNEDLTGEVYTFVEKGSKGDKKLYAKWEECLNQENKKIYDVITEKAYSDNESSLFVASSSGIKFSATAGITNGHGVYVASSTSNYDYPIYYYRGNVQNNNVIFGNHCWKIVRTTEDRGTKLIYNGLPTNGMCDNNGKVSQYGVSAFNPSAQTGSVGYSYGDSYYMNNRKYTTLENGVKFAKDVEYKDGKYILKDIYEIDDDFLSSSVEVMSNYHYSCFSVDESCETVNYIYYIRPSEGRIYFVNLANQKKHDNVLNDSILNSSNDTPSTIHSYVDNWFVSNLDSYSSYLEDAIWCNDRSIQDKAGWTLDGSIANPLYMGGYYRVAVNYEPSFQCPNDNDKFTQKVTNGNGKQMYPVGLLTVDEAAYSGYVWFKESKTYLDNGEIWWTMSPCFVSAGNSYIFIVYSILDSVHVKYLSNGAGGVRPSISLKYGTIIQEGTGTVVNPFVIKTESVN